MERVLIFSKISNLEYKRRKFKDLNEEELKRQLTSRGTNYETLLYYHDLHKTFEKQLIDVLKSFNTDVRVTNRFDFTEEKAEWADIIVPVGGDGTFLLAASKAKNSIKPVVGFNSDPNRSEGCLCLPKRYSFNIIEAIKRLKYRQFEWLLRNRIRTTLFNQSKIYSKCLHSFSIPDISISSETCKKGGFVVPALALNEVFMGEEISARSSHLEMYLDNGEEPTNMKCSGLCICTGTGSTSWHLSMNRLSAQTVAELLRLLDIQATEEKESLATVLADIYNQNLIFKPDDPRMAYTIRELISAGVWPHPKGIKQRAFANKIKVKSKCVNACLVIDGGMSYEFNDGAVAVLEIKPEDALRTVLMPD